MDYRLSRRAANLRCCLMDEFHLRGIEVPDDMIFFNSGQPSLSLYPIDLLVPIFDDLLTNKREVLAYPGSRGDGDLIRGIAARMARLGMGNPSPDNIIITNGGTGAAELISQMFLDPGDRVFTETPTFPETLDAFAKEFAVLEGVPMDIDGPIPEYLERMAREARPKFFYAIPDFQNPTGRCTSLERRKAIIRIARKYGFFILEDDPYRELHFDELPPATYYSLAPDCTIYMGSFSKTVAPGMRTGWLVLPDGFADKAESLLKATALSYPRVLHKAIADLIAKPEFDEHVEELRLDLSRRCRLVTSLMKEYIPQDLFEWEMPMGGMFLWCHLNPRISAAEFCVRTRDDYHVVFFPGTCFTPNYSGEEHSVRLTFARQTDDDMAEGVRRIAESLKNYL